MRDRFVVFVQLVLRFVFFWFVFLMKGERECDKKKKTLEFQVLEEHHW